jgi:GDPmannose 4,6-dehydratase
MVGKKVALIMGVTGQDGGYLARLLIEKGYEVHGMRRRVSIFNTERLDELYTDPHEGAQKLTLHYGDLADPYSIINVITRVNPTEIYNLAAMSHVGLSFEQPEYAGDIDALGTMRILESLRILGLTDTRVYQASTSELYGKVQEVPQNESTPFYPRSPYAIAKLYAYWITINYREAYGMFACNGILFNHESPTRGETFVTRKITVGLSKIYHGFQGKLYLGNLDAKRDWGHAADYVEMMWLMLQADVPDDYVIATGKAISVRDFLIKCLDYLGIQVEFKGEGVDEKALVTGVKNKKCKVLVGQCIVEVDPTYFRPTEVDLLLGDSSKAREKLGWNPKFSLDDLIADMMRADMSRCANSIRIQTN